MLEIKCRLSNVNSHVVWRGGRRGERERKRERKRGREREKEKKGDREREREREGGGERVECICVFLPYLCFNDRLTLYFCYLQNINYLTNTSK